VRLRALLTALLALLGGLLAWARSTRTQPPMPSIPPRETRRVAAEDGHELHVELGGREDADLTVLFVHGFLARSAEFDPQWEPLLGRVGLVRYDHRGHGGSGRNHHASDVDQLGRDLGRVLDDVAPRGAVVLVGHSMGGMTVMALAEQRPELFGERVRGVALLGTGAGHYIPGHPVENASRWASRRGLFGPALLLLRLLAPVGELLRPRNTRGMRCISRALLFGGSDANPSLVAQVQQMLEEPPLSTVASLSGALLRHDKIEALQVLRRVPVSVVHGSDDRLIRVEHAQATAADLGAAAELTVLPGVGHVLTRSAPHEVNVALDRLLARLQLDAAA